LPGVGQHLMDHPAIQISGYLPKSARLKKVLRGSYTYLRWSSGYPGMPEADMVMLAICRSAWHAVGARIGTLGSNVGKSFSTGEVRLNSADPDDEPYVNFNWLSDRRDLDRLCDAVRLMAGMLATEPAPQFLSNLFPSKFSQRVRDFSKRTRRNTILTGIAATLMDNSALARDLLFDRIISDSPKLAALLADPAALEDYVRNNVHGAWHASCTCRMGNPADPQTVVDPQGRVVGAQNLFIADASVMPDVTRTNTNLPVIMIAERMAEMIGARSR
jgi:5-(hydroxymethyl)furfural/furfural oxidase